jgi:hypothetical protein
VKFVPWFSHKRSSSGVPAENLRATNLQDPDLTIPGLITIDPEDIEEQGRRDLDRKSMVHFGHEPQFNLAPVFAATTAKDVGLPESNEDTYVVHVESSRAAIFDGSTESFAAQRWARLLAQHWAQSENWLDHAQREYAIAVSSMELSWAQAEAEKRGSFSTMSAIQMEAGGITATLIGDSCLFLVKSGIVIRSLPFTLETQFTSVPNALSSSPQDAILNSRALDESIWRINLMPNEVDEVVLATDAVSAWLLGDDHAQRWETLRQVTNDEEFSALVQAERSAGRMKVDDSTFVRLQIVVAE